MGDGILLQIVKCTCVWNLLPPLKPYPLKPYPQYVAFKDSDGVYLNTGPSKIVPYFSSNDVGETGNAYEIFTTRDSHIYLKNHATGHGSYWGALFYDPSDESIRIMPEKTVICDKEYNEVDGDPTDTNLLFSVYRVDKNIVSLRHSYTKNFMVIHKWMPGWNFLMTNSDTITSDCRLQVVEPVLARELNVFEFHSDRARIYDRRPLTLAEGAVNNPTDKEQEYTLQFTYTKSTTSTWSTSKSWTVSTKLTITSGVPFIEAGSIEIGGELSKHYDMGEAVEESEQVQSSFTVKVPSNKRATVTAMATRGTCDVPYSYDQVDHMPNGDVKRTIMSDGVYTGVNAYFFDYNVSYQPL
ncbi:hypothetical protein SOVF_056200 isoform B [Spinacia oleracea]|nr:hypothetical protein SOVF_056200 isoform B [Spinacia oleracea]